MEINFEPFRYFNFEYTIYGADRIPERHTEEYTFKFIERLGLTPEAVGTPKICDDSRYCNYTYSFNQYKDGMYLGSDAIVTYFAPGHTVFYSRGWHVDYENVPLYDLDQSRQNAIDYLLSIDELCKPDCDVSYNPNHASGHEVLGIIDDRFVYHLYAGTCQVEYFDGHHHWYAVVVDALNGKPLYAENKMVF